jgi:Rrf2 family protein
VWLSARVEYAVRAALEIASSESEFLTAEALADRQGISVSFLENIIGDLRRAGLVASRRGRGGGHRLARPSDTITIADVMRAEIGNLADIHGKRPESAEYPGAATHLPDVWVAARSAYRQILESVTLADVLCGEFPEVVATLLADPRSWESVDPQHLR